MAEQFQLDIDPLCKEWLAQLLWERFGGLVRCESVAQYAIGEIQQATRRELGEWLQNKLKSGGRYNNIDIAVLLRGEMPSP